MEEQTKLALAAAVLGGYVLGRTKKGRLALAVATAVSGRGIGLDPRELAAEGARRLAEAPQVAGLKEQFREQGMTAAGSALSAVTDRAMGSLADTISGRAERLGDTDGEAGEDDEDGEEELTAEEEDHVEEAEEEEEPRPARRRRAFRSSGGSASSERRGTRPSSAKKAPAKKPTGKRTEKTASHRSGRRR
ncbi:hypothetical protein [Streptomyces sp. NPDC059142]|uniref:hypothetical protein n=1 Tax=Streptomyces sp. NPDC059142 TaxID=3346739 RepID=UPI0036C2FFAB